jgi:hypothetical protein
MPYFKVAHNGKVLANAGSPRISVLIAHVIVGAQGPASLTAHGMRATKKRREHFDWISQPLRSGDHVEIAYVAKARATKPRSKSVTDISNIEEELQRLQAQLGEFEARATQQAAPQLPTWTRAPRPRILRVSTSKISTIDATLGDEEHLQAVLNFTSCGCVLEVDAMTVLDDGSTKGKTWLKTKLRLGQRVRITYAT